MSCIKRLFKKISKKPENIPLDTQQSNIIESVLDSQNQIKPVDTDKKLSELQKILDDINKNKIVGPYDATDDFPEGCKENGKIISNLIKGSISIDTTLHVIAVISNPCEYESRWRLAKEFFQRIEKTPNMILYTVELSYKEQVFHVTDPKNPRHLQLRSQTPLWHKENMINLGIKNLLPKEWKAVAFIDADIEYDPYTNQTPENWAIDTLKVMTKFNVVQLFSHAIDMDQDKNTMTVFQGGAYQHSNSMKNGQGVNYWHPGFAWALTRDFYDKTLKLFDKSILGSGDYVMFLCWINKDFSLIRERLSKDYDESYLSKIREYHEKCLFAEVNLGYIPYTIKHHFHGLKSDRGYNWREQILTRNKYNPYTHITTNENGVIVPSENFPAKMIQEILSYFYSRNE